MTDPSTGPAVAGFGRRVVAFVVDAALSVLIAVLSGHHPSAVVNGHRQPSLAYNVIVYVSFLLIELVFVSLAGQTPGMRAAGIAVVRFRDGGRAAVQWVLVRTLLLAAVLPALIVDGSGRALHDRASGTTMLRLR